MGIRLAVFVVDRLRRRGEDVELIDAKAVNLPMLDRMTRNTRRAAHLRLLNSSAARSATPTDSCSSPANIIGVSSPD
jgi:hypothetical protein